MRVVIQRVSQASVSINGRVKSTIGVGLLIFLGIMNYDETEDMHWLTKKIPKIRIFPDNDGLMNQSVVDVNGEILLISQFTLYGNLDKGLRPSFNRSAPPDIAVRLYKAFIYALSKNCGKPVATGEFGAMMEIDALNDGPVTLIIDSRERKF